MDGRPLFIALAGNIATGKSTLSRRLASALSLPAFEELPDQNPWFERAAIDPGVWSLHTELHFLIAAVRAQRKLITDRHGGVLERPPREHVAVFARSRADRGWLSRGEFDLLEAVWGELVPSLAEGPDALVVLHARPETLLSRVRARNWDTEQLIDEPLLRALQALYRDFTRSWRASPVVDIDTEEHDVRSDAGLMHVIERLQEVSAH
jgi:deoxyadenosine/deoxycytidine kinase